MCLNGRGNWVFLKQIKVNNELEELVQLGWESNLGPCVAGAVC